jgi:UDP-2,4-diacetamido-2,4,6-trideoxy-beta-L-altropyranose hydrolase
VRPGPHICFRADADPRLGAGHVMRCLALAQALRQRGAVSSLITRSLSASLASAWTELGAAVHRIGDEAEDAAATAQVLDVRRCDAIVVDHYGLDATWERSVKRRGQVLMAIDDLADRPHDVDLLLDQNLGRLREHYDRWVPPTAARMIGPDFALLRPDFPRLRPASLARRSSARMGRLLITMGGSDPQQATQRVLQALPGCALPHDACICVVLGALASTRPQVERALQRLAWCTELRQDVPDMAQLMAESDLAIGAAGSSVWERCSLGLPSMILVLADNQREAAAALEASGAATVLSSLPALGVELPARIAALSGEPDRLRRMSASAARLCDGLGADRVAAALLQRCAGAGDT